MKVTHVVVYRTNTFEFEVEQRDSDHGQAGAKIVNGTLTIWDHDKGFKTCFASGKWDRWESHSQPRGTGDD